MPTTGHTARSDTRNRTDSISKDNTEYPAATSLGHKLLDRYQRVRNKTEALCQPLEIEDYGIQSMEDTSPPKWHLAHVSWFFETFILRPYLSDYPVFNPGFAYLFNSYYETAGRFHPRPERGLLARPTVEEVYQYRAHVDKYMQQTLSVSDHTHRDDIKLRTSIGINHEQQHQELMLTDIKHNFACNPLRPVYRDLKTPPGKALPELQWLTYEGGLIQNGFQAEGFCYDNELPAHKVYVAPFKLASRLVSNGEFIEFIEAGGYQNVRLWLSDAWKQLRQQNWQAPLYWEKSAGKWWHMTLTGMQPINENAPVAHVSFYEADAFARWKGKRLPGEAEWELAASNVPVSGNLLASDYLQPIPMQTTGGLNQMFGDVWEWTQSSYAPYPGYQPLSGTLGEYNGKFMSSQMVLRGGSCFTPDDHIRASYRNFFYPGDRWQCSGIRLAD